MYLCFQLIIIYWRFIIYYTVIYPKVNCHAKHILNAVTEFYNVKVIFLGREYSAFWEKITLCYFCAIFSHLSTNCNKIHSTVFFPLSISRISRVQVLT